MNAAEADRAREDCKIELLDSEACERYVSWLLGEESAADGADGLAWALAHCDDGVTWGRYDVEGNTWVVGSDVAPGVSPPIRSQALQELRLFGERSEILIWRTDAGFRGRVLRETEPATDRSDASNPVRLLDEPRVIRGAFVVARCGHGFTHIGDAAGAEQVLPLAVNNELLRAAQVRLHVRHYYEADMKTGAVRIAATRLVRLTDRGYHDG